MNDGAARRSRTRGGAPGRRLADHLPPALGGGEIAVVFQPQVAMAGGAIVGAEALARWRRPGQNEVGAEQLLAAAGRADMAAALADEIHAVALDEAARWPAELAALRLSINVTAGDLARGGFANTLLERAVSAGFPANRLTLEITEHDLIGDLDAAAAVLAEIRAAGCRVALDDFGTGYSGLAYLKMLPIDALKLDARLTHDIEGSQRAQVVVRGVIGIARALSLAVIVEGVETERQRVLLAEAGADIFQGFLCSGPVASDELAGLAQRWRG